MNQINSARNFLAENPTAKVIIYESGIPTGVAKTKGHGDPGEIRVLLADDKFKTRNSRHHELAYIGQIRRDYGTVKGHTAKMREKAEKVKKAWENVLDLIRAV